MTPTPGGHPEGGGGGKLSLSLFSRRKKVDHVGGERKVESPPTREERKNIRLGKKENDRRPPPLSF